MIAKRSVVVMEKYLKLSRERNILKAEIKVFDSLIEVRETLLVTEVTNPDFIQFIQAWVSGKTIKYIIFDIEDPKLMGTLKDLFRLVDIEYANIKKVDALNTVAVDIDDVGNKFKVSEILFGS